MTLSLHCYRLKSPFSSSLECWTFLISYLCNLRGKDIWNLSPHPHPQPLFVFTPHLLHSRKCISWSSHAIGATQMSYVFVNLWNMTETMCFATIRVAFVWLFALEYTTWAQLNEWQLSGDVKAIPLILWIYSVLLCFSRYKINCNFSSVGVWLPFSGHLVLVLKVSWQVE